MDVYFDVAFLQHDDILCVLRILLRAVPTEDRDGSEVTPNKIQDVIDVIDIDGEDGCTDPFSPISVWEERIAKARGAFGLKQNHNRGDQADQGAVEDHRVTDVAKVLQLLNFEEDSVLLKAIQRLHVNWYHCGTERSAAGAPF